MKKLNVWGLLVAVVLACTIGSANAQMFDQQAATTLVRGLAHDMVASLAATGVSADQRSQTVHDLLGRYSNVETLAQQILGRSWTTATAEEKARFSALLTDYITILCAGMSKDMPSTTHVDVGAAERDGQRIVVHSVVVVAGSQDATPVDWSVATSEDGHLFVADVSAEGVSLARTMSSDFRAVLFANGGRLAALIAAMDNKIHLALSHS